MKKFLVLLLIALLPLEAQQDQLQAEALRAFQSEDYETAKTLFESLVAADPRNSVAQNYLKIIAQRQKRGLNLEDSLRKIVIPVVDFHDVTVREAVGFVAQKVRELSQGKQPMNVVWMVPADQAGLRVTLSLRNVPASEVLRYVGDSSNLRFSFDPLAVKIRPVESPTKEKTAE